MGDKQSKQKDTATSVALKSPAGAIHTRAQESSVDKSLEPVVQDNVVNGGMDEGVRPNLDPANAVKYTPVEISPVQILPVENLPVQILPVTKTKHTEGLDDKMAAPSLLPGDRGDNPVVQESVVHAASRDGVAVAECNGVSPSEEAYAEFQALFKFVNDVKLSNRKIMKELTEEQQKYKKTYDESETKVKGLEECVTYLEDRVSQRENQITKFKGIIQVLLQKVSQLSSALEHLPGDNGVGCGSQSPADDQEEVENRGETNSVDQEDQNHHDNKYPLPKPLTDTPKAPVTIPKDTRGFRSNKVTVGTDNRVARQEKPVGKVLRRAVLERSKCQSGENSTTSGKGQGSTSPGKGQTSTNGERVHGSSSSGKGQGSTNDGKVPGSTDGGCERQKEEGTRTIPSNIPMKSSKKKSPPRPNVPVHNEFRNTLTEVTDMVKSSSRSPQPCSMDLDSWVEQANNAMVMAGLSTCPRGSGPHVILCLDVSQSMEGPAFDSMVEGTMKFIDGVENINQSLGFQTNLALVTFGHMTCVAHNLTSDFAALRTAVRSLTPGGTSPLTAGLLMSVAAAGVRAGHALRIGEYLCYPRIIIFTDGRATSECQLVGEDRVPGGDFSYEVLVKMMAVAKDVNDRKFSVSYVAVGDFFPGYMERVVEITKGQRYPMEELDRAIRLTKNFSLAVKLIPHIRPLTGGDMTNRQAVHVIVTGVCSNDPFVTDQDVTDIVQIVVDSDNLPKSAESEDEDEGHREMDEKMLPLGTRVRRGPDWSYVDQDTNMPGTVVSHNTNGWLWVIWDNGHRNKYCYGNSGKYDVVVVDEPRILNTGQTIKVGCMVKRGPDWTKENRDGGVGSVGSVIHVYPNNTVMVRWPNKQMVDHNFGCDGKFEVTVCDPSEQLAHMMEASYQLGATGGSKGSATDGDTGSGTGGDTGSATGGDTGSGGSGGRVASRRRDNIQCIPDSSVEEINRIMNQRNKQASERSSAERSSQRSPSERSSAERSSQRSPSERLASSSAERSAERLPSEMLSSERSQLERSPAERLPSKRSPAERSLAERSLDERLASSSAERSAERLPSEMLSSERSQLERSPAERSPSKRPPAESSSTEKSLTKTTLPESAASATRSSDSSQSERRSSHRPPPQSPHKDTAMETVSKVTWQYKDEYGGWTCYSEENSTRIEKTHSKAPKGMTVINGGKHRILLSKMIQMHTTTKHMTGVRRQVK